MEVMLLQADDFARREPAKAIASSFGVGLLIHLLPLRAIASLLVGIACSGLRPILLFLGLMKACDLYRTNKQPTNSHE